MYKEVIDLGNNNAREIEAYYSKGGRNYFPGDMDKRGVWLRDAAPVKLYG